jgi:hypothetical protein
MLILFSGYYSDVVEVGYVSNMHFVPIFSVIMYRLVSFCVHRAFWFETQNIKTTSVMDLKEI